MSGGTFAAPRTCAVEGCGVVLGEGVLSVFCAVHRSAFRDPQGDHCAAVGCLDKRSFGAIYCPEHLAPPRPAGREAIAARLEELAREAGALAELVREGL